MSIPDPSVPVEAPHGSSAVAVAVAAERRWAIVVAAIIVLLLATMVLTGFHWAAMPGRVETIDPRTLHVSGEFVENNLGTGIGADGRIVVRLIAQQYSFEPQCIVVPSGTPVTFRGTSTDAIHGFVIGKTNANVMLVPGFVATFTTTFDRPGELPMPCHEYCGAGHAAMWAKVQVIAPEAFLARVGGGRKATCVDG